jgi:hypothetical protein
MASPALTPLDDLQRLGQFLLYMQKDDGGFYSKYLPHAGGRDEQWTSLYYPGEAALGLVMLYERDHQPQWLDAALRALDYLARLREGRTTVEADHWAILATARLQHVCAEVDGGLLTTRLQQHVVQIAESMLAERPPHPPRSSLHGCFTDDGRTTPTATRLEGLLAALEVVPDNQHDLRTRMRSAITDGIEFLLRAYLPSGEHHGAMPRAIATLPPGHAAHSRSFNRRATEVRIDYAQHALSAMLAFSRAMDRPSRMS